jgi:hypothetical protein
MDRITREAKLIRDRARRSNANALKADMARLNRLSDAAKAKGNPMPVMGELASARRAVAAYQKAEKSKGNYSYAKARNQADRVAKPSALGCATTTSVGLICIALGIRALSSRAKG